MDVTKVFRAAVTQSNLILIERSGGWMENEGRMGGAGGSRSQLEGCSIWKAMMVTGPGWGWRVEI